MVIALAFHKASLPAELVGDLRTLAEDARVPLACRSSSALEDALGRPFAGVYGTKMIPGNQPDVGRAVPRARRRDQVRLRVARSSRARARYRRAAGELPEPEKMAVVVQEVVGRRHDGRFYPDVSGVARSYSFYPVGPAAPEEGIVDLAVGLGKTIVDGGLVLDVLPRPPAHRPARRVRPRAAQDDADDTVGRERRPAAAARPDGRDRVPRRGGPRRRRNGRHAALRRLDVRRRRRPPRPRHRPARPARPRLCAGCWRWDELSLVPLLRALMRACEEELGAPVEIEFALSLPPGEPGRFGFLQVRPLARLARDGGGRRARHGRPARARRLDAARSATGATRCATWSTSSPRASRRASRPRSPTRSSG